MDQREADVRQDERPAPNDQPNRLEDDIDGIRGSLTGLVSELDRRWREARGWRDKLREHPLAAVGIGGLVGAGVVMALGRGRRRSRQAIDLPAPGRGRTLTIEVAKTLAAVVGSVLVQRALQVRRDPVPPKVEA
jgi:hypothetical protein